MSDTHGPSGTRVSPLVADDIVPIDVEHYPGAGCRRAGVGVAGDMASQAPPRVCSFCDRPQDARRRLITAAGVAAASICTECVAIFAALDVS
jgi:hypothetical protein